MSVYRFLSVITLVSGLFPFSACQVATSLGAAGPQGGKGDPGPQGPQGATGAAGFTDGARLRHIILESTGLQTPVGIWDTQYAMECKFGLLNGAIRCIPVGYKNVTSVVYSDTACTQPRALLVTQSGSCDDPKSDNVGFLFLPAPPSADCTLGIFGSFYKKGPLVTGETVYRKDSMNACIALSPGPSDFMFDFTAPYNNPEDNNLAYASANHTWP